MDREHATRQPELFGNGASGTGGQQHEPDLRAPEEAGNPFGDCTALREADHDDLSGRDATVNQRFNLGHDDARISVYVRAGCTLCRDDHCATGRKRFEYPGLVVDPIPGVGGHGPAIFDDPPVQVDHMGFCGLGRIGRIAQDRARPGRRKDNQQNQKPRFHDVHPAPGSGRATECVDPEELSARRAADMRPSALAQK